MKREGVQHGMVRTSRILPSTWNPKPNSRFINRFDSPPTAGLFAKVQPRPTNHSKFTGKCTRPRCNGCHIHPCGKSKDKTKGTQKLKSLDVASNYRLMTWRLVDVGPSLNFSGFSATGMLDHLTNGDDYVEDEIDHGDLGNSILSSREEEEEKAALGIEEIAADKIDDDDKIDDVDDDDDGMSFCDVSLMLDQIEEDEGWFLVAEM